MFHLLGGADDFFSSDFTDKELMERLSHVSSKNNGLKKALICYSGSDEYVPKHIDTNLLLDRLCYAMNHNCKENDEKVAIPLMLENANHNLSQGEGDMNAFVKEIGNYLRSVILKN